MLSNRILTIGFTAILLFNLSCKDNPVEPPIKDPRTYRWTIDTIAYPGSFQTSMRDIWGSSPNDVYVVGHNSFSEATMFRFDGKSWKTTGFHVLEGGSISGALSLSAIYGFSATNIYAVGQRIYDNPTRPPNFLDSSLIIHFDGRQWSEQKVQRGRTLWSISATAPNDIWTCGTDGTLYQFNGFTWRRDSTVVSIPPDGTFLLWDIKAKNSSEVYMIGNVHQNSLARTTRYFFRTLQSRWTVVDSFVVQPGQYETKFGENGLWISPEGTLYSFGPHILPWTGTSWVRVYETFDALRKMAGISERNIFAVGDFGKVLHFNGNDWYEFKALRNPDAVYSSVWTDGREVFVVGFFNDGSKTLILRGK